MIRRPPRSTLSLHDALPISVVIANRHLGDAASDEAYCGAGGYPPGLEYVTVCTTHEALHRIFGDAPEFGTPQSQSDLPAIGTAGAPVSATAVFDGWGYAQLYRNSGTKLRRVDS